MAARRAAGPQSSLMPAIAAGAVIGTLVAVWQGLPAGVAIVAAVMAYGFTEPAPEMTGPKSAGSKSANPASPEEARKLETWQAAQQMKTAPLLAAWIPGWPIQMSFVGALLAAAVAVHLPGREPWVPIVSAVSAFAGIAGFAAARRKATGNPGTTAATLDEVVKQPAKLVQLVVFGVAGAAAGWVASTIAANLLADSPAGPPTNRLLFSIVCAAALAGVAMVGVLRPVALAGWRELCEVRDSWMPRWQTLKVDPAPDCIETKMVGPLRVTTFATRGSMSADQLMLLTPKLAPMLPAGLTVAIIPHPAESKQGPQPGTISPSKVRIVEWQDDEWPDIGNLATPADVVEAAIETAVAMSMLAQATGPAVITDVEPLHTEESEGALWRARVAWPRGPGGEGVRVAGSGAMAMTGGMLGLALLDHRDPNGDCLYVGSPQADVSQADADRIDQIQNEDEWIAAWKQALKTGVNPPAVQAKQRASANLAGGQVVERHVFAVRRGEDVNAVMSPDVERKLSTARPGTRWLTISGWTMNTGTRSGTRHVQAFAVYLSDGQVPDTPDKLAPCPGAGPQWVLSGHVNRAFDQQRMVRPEVVSARCLTKPSSRTHIWEIRLRLYTVTFGDVRGMGERLRQAFGVKWLRVADAEDGCLLYVGGLPRQVQLADPARDSERLTRLDWEQAWVDAKLAGIGGRVPKLVSAGRLPRNDQVEVLDFDLPDGVDREMIRKAMPKLRTNTGSDYLELRPHPNGARSIRMLACESDPMPERVDFDPEMAAAGGTGFAFATGVEGEPVTFDPEDAPHLAVLGGTGSGKTISAKIIIAAAVAAGFELHIADPTKGAADLMFATPWARTFSTTMEDTEAALEYVYAEIRRRVDINKRFGCDYRTVPEEHRYGRILVVLDEFESLYKSFEPVGKPSDDPRVEETREKAVAHNAALTRVLDIVGRIAREARSAGVVMVVIGQKMVASEMEKVGLKTLKNNLGRLLMGKTTWGDISSALRNPTDAADLGDRVPRGRGLYESMVANAIAVQVWFAPHDVLVDMLRAQVPPVEPLDLSPYRRQSDAPKGPAVQEVSLDDVAPVSDVIDRGEFELSLDDLLAVDLDDDEEVVVLDTNPGAEPAAAGPAAAEPDWDAADWGGTAAAAEPDWDDLVPVPDAGPDTPDWSDAWETPAADPDPAGGEQVPDPWATAASEW